MSNTALAKRYAEAFCRLAHDHDVLEGSLEFLEVLAEAFEPSLDVIFSNPDVSEDERHDVVDKAFEAQSEDGEVFRLVRNFCKLLVDKNRFRFLDEIVDACREESDRLLNRKRARVETPYELGGDQKERLTRQLAERFGADIHLEEEISEQLMAGLRIQVDDYLMNYSIQNDLDDLYGRLTRST